MGKVRDRIKSVRRGLTSLDDKPIGKAALTVVLFLDLFILISIFQGLDDHTRQLAGPWEYVPQYCRDMVIDEDWNESNRLERIGQIVSRYRGSYRLIDETDRVRQEHPVCAPISTLIRSIQDDRELSTSLSKYLRIRSKASQVRAEHERVKGTYDTALLEEIADRNNGNQPPASVRTKITETADKLEALIQEEKLLAAALIQNPKLQELFAIIESVPGLHRDGLLADLRSENFWYPVKRLGMEMLFLLPLVIIFYFWNAKSIARRRPFQALVSSHLLVVVFIPVLFKIIELVYDIIPKKLLKRVMDLLESLNLVAIWHYLVMGAAILAALVLIYILQKKLFSHERLIEKRIARGLCQECGARLPGESVVCPICGFKQYRQCSHCDKPTYVYGKYCRECGAEKQSGST
jgi:ribosomal protein L40E